MQDHNIGEILGFTLLIFSVVSIISCAVCISFRDEIYNAISTKLISIQSAIRHRSFATFLVTIGETKKYYGKLVPDVQTLAIYNLKILGFAISNGNVQLTKGNRVRYTEFEAATRTISEFNKTYFSAILTKNGKYTTLYSPYKDGLTGHDKRYTTIVIDNEHMDYDTILASIKRCSRLNPPEHEKRHELMAEYVCDFLETTNCIPARITIHGKKDRLPHVKDRLLYVIGIESYGD